MMARRRIWEFIKKVAIDIDDQFWNRTGARRGRVERGLNNNGHAYVMYDTAGDTTTSGRARSRSTAVDKRPDRNSSRTGERGSREMTALVRRRPREPPPDDLSERRPGAAHNDFNRSSTTGRHRPSQGDRQCFPDPPARLFGIVGARDLLWYDELSKEEKDRANRLTAGYANASSARP